MEKFSDKNKLPKNNLTDSDNNAIEHFSRRNDLVITEADKDGATVILDVKDNIAKANEQLQDNLFYQKLNVDPTANCQQCYRKFQKARTIIKLDSKQTHRRRSKNTLIPYFSQRSYKPNIPGRLVVSSVDCHTSDISKFVDHYLQPNAKSLP